MSSETAKYDSTEDIVLPTKSVDPDESLEDRLTDQVLNSIGPARYFKKDENGEIQENWANVFRRVANNIAEAEYVYDGDESNYNKWSRKFEEVMRQQRFIPNSPTLFNAGTEIQQLSACFVNSPEDSMEDITDVQSNVAQIFKSGGGVGYAFHHLRPKGALISSTGRPSSGPVSFMEIYDATCNTVKQGSRRRGAQMAIMHSQHPDIGRFAVAKRGEDSYTNFNISFGITDEFVDAVRNDEEYVLYDPETRPSEDHPLSSGEVFEVVPETAHFYDPKFEDSWNEEFDKPSVGYGGILVEENFWRDYADEMESDFSEFKDRIEIEPGEPMKLPAKFVWQLLIDGAWNNGEPGIFHMDHVNREHSFDTEEHSEHYIHASNPCSEQPLEDLEACNLGHVNLSLMKDENAPTFHEFTDRFGDKSEEELVGAYLNRAIDYDLFYETVDIGVRFLDNVVTMSDFPLEDITRQVGNKRKIGLGIMGFHQLLIQFGVEYGSEISYEFARQIMKIMDERATEYSHTLAKERSPFNEYMESKWSNPTKYPDWFRNHAHKNPEEYPDGYEMRNHNVTTIAPTGTTSMIGNTTGGCEPIPRVSYMKNVGNDIQGEENLIVFDDYFERTLEANGIDVSVVKEEAREKMMNNKFGGVDELSTVPDKIAEVFVTTEDLSAEQHIRIQGAFQEYCDSGISKTINMPFDTDIDEVGEAFLLADELGIKGTTIYRDGSRNEQVIKDNVDERKFTEEEKEEIKEEAKTLVRKDDEIRDEIEKVINFAKKE